MKIWIDADACPGAIKEIILKAVLKREIETVFVANKPLYVPKTPLLSLILVSQGPDVADQYIVDNAQAGDFLITQDIPLVALVLAKGVAAMSFHGTLFTDTNIGERLSVRNFLHDLRESGTQTSGPPPFGEKEKRQFSNTFDQFLTKQFKRTT